METVLAWMPWLVAGLGVTGTIALVALKPPRSACCGSGSSDGDRTCQPG
jgi:hypothetical protein